MGKMVRRNPYHCQAVAAASARAIFHSNAYSVPSGFSIPTVFPPWFFTHFRPAFPGFKGRCVWHMSIAVAPPIGRKAKMAPSMWKEASESKIISLSPIWMSDWVSDCVTDWMTDWRECDRVSRLIAWLMHEAIDWLMPLLISDCLNVCPTLFF